jgi:hypothetical protein
MPSRIIDDDYAAEIINRFQSSNPKGQTSFYNFAVDDISRFRDTVDVNVPAGKLQKGIAFRFGRPSPKDSLNIAIEAVLYKRSATTNSIEEYRFLENSHFYGRLSPNFQADLHSPDERTTFNQSINVNDASGVLMLLIDFRTLVEFIGDSSEFSSIKIEFARNDMDQLTAVLSRRDNAGNRVISSVSGVNGLYLDDHDLIPPP